MRVSLLICLYLTFVVGNSASSYFQYSSPTTITIGSAVNTGASNCGSLNNGNYEVTSVFENGAAVGGATYNYTFYNNSADEIQAKSADNSIDGLSVGSYSVVITNTASGHSSAFLPFTINDASALPIVNAIITNDSRCSSNSGSGSITVTVSNNGGQFGYTFTWYRSTLANVGVTGSSTHVTNGSTYNGATITVTSSGGYTGNRLTGLPANTSGEVYWVRVADNTNPSSGCTIDFSQVIIEDPAEIVLVTGNLTVIAQEDCSPADGSITVNNLTVDGTGGVAVTGYTFKLYQNNGTTEIASAFTGATASGLASGTYFVEATNSVSCVSNKLQVILGTNVTAPSFSFSQTAATACGGSSPNGVLNVTGITVADYTYVWYLGANTSGTVLTASTNPGNGSVPVFSNSNSTVSGLIAGTYTVSVTDNAGDDLGCVTTQSVVLGTNFPTITVNTATNTGASNCGSLNNGSYEVTGVFENGATVGGATYNYTFYNNAATVIQAASADNSIDGLAVGSYSVVITNTGSTCSSASIPFTILDASIQPIVSTTVVNDSHCATNQGNGSITATVSNNSGQFGYTFTWYHSTTANVGNTGASTAITSGVTTYNGKVLTISSSGGYTNNVLSGLPANAEGQVYWVRVTDNTSPSSGCRTDFSKTIIEDPTDLHIGVLDVVNSSSGQSDGSVQVNTLLVDGSSTTNFSGFTFYLVGSNGSTVIANNSSGSFSSLAEGAYHINATNDLDCRSDYKKFSTNSAISLFSVNLTQNTANSICDPSFGVLNANGSVTASVQGDGDDNYSFTWYRGRQGNVGGSTALTDGLLMNNSTIDIDESGVGTSIVSGLTEGTYWVNVEDLSGNNQGLIISSEINLHSNYTPVTVSVAGLAITDVTDCTGADDGTITIELADISGSGAAITDYTLSITGTTSNSDDNTALALAASPQTISNLHADTYNIKVTDETTGCVSPTYQVQINVSNVRPAMSSYIEADNFCTGGNGYVRVSVSTPTTTESDYNFTWYTGTGTGTLLTAAAAGTDADGTAAAPNGADEKNGLAAGTYTVVVETIDATVDGFGCTNQIIVVVPDDPYILTITNRTLTNPTDCDPLNGQINITQLSFKSNEDAPATLSGGSLTDAEFTYNLYTNAALTTHATGSPKVGVPPTFTGLAAGTYYATLTVANGDATIPGCTSPALQYVLTESAVKPTMALVETTKNSICDPSFAALEANGVITATASGGADDNYTFTWYKGPQGNVGGSTLLTDGLVVNNSTIDIDNSGTGTSVLSFITEGEYWVIVEDSGPTGSNDGCTVTQGVDLTSNYTPVTLNLANITINDATDCTTPDDGSIVIDAADFNSLGMAADFAGLQISIDGVATNPDDATLNPTAVATYTISNLAPDTYNITITDETTGCVSPTYQVQINSVPVQPQLTSVITADNFCTGGNGTARIEVNDEGSDDEANYTFEWFNGTGTGGTQIQAPTAGIAGAGGGGDERASLESGTYTVNVVNTQGTLNGTGCFNSIVFTISDDSYQVSITDKTLVDPTDNNPLSGSIAITQLTYTSNLVASATITGVGLNDADYTYKLFSDAGLTTQVSGSPITGTAPTFTGLAAGTYYGVITIAGTDNVFPGCSSASVAYTLTQIATNPTANPVTASTNEDTSLTGALSGSSPVGATLTFATATQPTHGTLTLQTNGSYSYSPTQNYNGTDSFTFTVNDGTLTSVAATVSITINAVNDAPVANAANPSTNEDTTLSGNLGGSDVEGSGLSFAVAAQPAHGTLTLQTNGSYTYSPVQNYNGTDSFTFTVNDGTLTSVAATVSITVHAVNDAPVAHAANPSTNEDTTLIGTLSGSDAEGSALTFAIATQPTHGTLTLQVNGSYSYSPTQNYNGTDSFTFTVNDGTLTNGAATVSITVHAVNDAPVANMANPSTNEDTTLIGTLSGSDAEGSALTFAIATQPTHGTVNLQTNGSYTYSPVQNYNGTDSFTFTVNDGTLTSAAATVNITIHAVNDAPVANVANPSTNEDTTLNGTLSGSDVEGSALTFAVATHPTHGTLTLQTNGSYIYSPVQNYNGTDSFTFTVNDGTLTSGAATVSITIHEVNDAPIANAANPSTNEDTTLSGTLTGSDVEGSVLTFASATQPTHGILTLQTNGSYTYSPVQNYNGTDSFTFTVNDGTLMSVAATVSITVNAVNDAPVANAANPSTNEDTTLSGTLTGSDVEGSALSFVATTQPTHGTLTLQENGSYTYSPTQNYNGTDSFTFTVNDGTLTSAAATVNISINAVNDAPTDITLLVESISDTDFLMINLQLETMDVDPDSFVYSLASGQGSNDNGLFALDGNKLSTTHSTFQTRDNNFRIRLKTLDLTGLSFEKSFLLVIDYCNNSISINNSMEQELILPVYSHQSIGCVTHDEQTGKNKIIWEKGTRYNLSKYNIYREGSVEGVYSKIGETNIGSELEFIDLESDPFVKSYKYKISVVDNCGIESELSDFHKTIHLTSSWGFNNNVSLIWNQYLGVDYLSTELYKKEGQKPWILLDVLASSNTSFTDKNYNSRFNTLYRVDVVLSEEIDNSGRAVAVYSRISSNLINIGSANTLSSGSVDEDINIYPNPTTGIVNIELSGVNRRIRIVDLSGMVLLEETIMSKKTLDLNHFKPGVYLLQVIDGGVQTIKITKGD